MKWIRFVVIGVIIFLAGRYAWQRIFVTEETRVQRAIAELEEAVEKGSLLKLEAGIAQSYSDDQGLDKQTLLGAVQAFRQQYPSIFIHLSDMTITVQPDGQTAEAVFIAKILASSAAGGADAELRSDRYRLKLEKIDNRWKLIRAETPELKFD